MDHSLTEDTSLTNTRLIIDRETLSPMAQEIYRRLEANKNSAPFDLAGTAQELTKHAPAIPATNKETNAVIVAMAQERLKTIMGTIPTGP